MELRPELTPPALDESKLHRLAHLADRLDGARAGEFDEFLDEFNRLAGTTIPIEDFQGIYKAEDHEDWVRGILYRQVLTPDSGLSRDEMVEIVSRVSAFEVIADHIFYLELFLVNCKHPSGTDLIYWPDLVPELPKDREPTNQEIADLAMRGQT
ncbi:hypothetical protein ACYOEI_31020 [Singulisphaera rosea]